MRSSHSIIRAVALKTKTVVAAGLSISALLAAASIIFAGCTKPAGEKPKASRDDAIPVSVAKVEMVPLDRTLPLVGTLFAKEEATIGARVEGQVESTRVDFGEHVTRDQELAMIDTASYEVFAQQSAANVTKAKANALNAEQNLKRILELKKNKISSISELDSATALAEQARAEVKAVEAANAIAQLNLDRSHVKAPFEGTVSERVATAGDYVKIGSPLFRLVNDYELKYIVQAPERYAGEVKLDQSVQFTVDAWPGQCFEGKVSLISPSVSTATRAFNLGARVQNSERKLKANTFARGELILDRAVPTPVVPLDAIMNFAGVTKVFVIDGLAARAREIKIGRIKEGRQEVLEGLKAGELIAVTGQTKLFDGAKVRIQTEPAKTPTPKPGTAEPSEASS